MTWRDHTERVVYDRTGMIETIDGRYRRCQKLTAAAATGSYDRRCQTLPSCPVGQRQTRRHNLQLVVCQKVPATLQFQ